MFITGYPGKAGHRTLNGTEGTCSKMLRMSSMISIPGIQIQLGNFHFRQKTRLQQTYLRIPFTALYLINYT